MAITHRLDDAHIQRLWELKKTPEIKNAIDHLILSAHEAQPIEDQLHQLLFLAFACGFKSAIG